MERRDFLLDPLLSEAPGHSFISSEERSGDDEKIRDRKLSDKVKQSYDKAKTNLDTLLPSTRPKHLTDGVDKNLDAFTIASIGTIGCNAIDSSAMRSFGGAKSAARRSGGGLCDGCCAIFCSRKKVAPNNNTSAPPVRGNYWDDITGKWVEMNLYNELDDLVIKPEDDGDVSLCNFHMSSSFYYSSLHITVLSHLPLVNVTQLYCLCVLSSYFSFHRFSELQE